MQGGVEYYLTKGSSFLGGNAKTFATVIAGGGSVTPFSAATGASEYTLNNNLGQQFNQNPTLISTYPQLAVALCSYGVMSGAGVTCPPTPSPKPTTVAFVLPNRTRFYRDFFVGLRLRTFYYSGDCVTGSDCKVRNIYPGTFDLRFGEDETVTAGYLRKFVLTLTGNYPLPGTNGAVRIFGSYYLRTAANKNTNPLVLVPTAFVPLDTATVVVQPIRASDQDYFRLGLGVDLVALISKWLMKPPAAP